MNDNNDIMKIVIIANFPSNLDGSNAQGRFLYLGEMLCSKGHQVEMLVSDFDHGNKIHRAEGSINQDAYRTKITALHEPGYPNNLSLRRLCSHYVWGVNVGKYLKNNQKPDLVYAAVPSLTAAVKASDYCRKNGVKFVIDVQDLWPEAFAIAIKNKFFRKALIPINVYANHIYRSADEIVAVSNTYVERALSVNKKTNHGLSVYLGNNCVLFDAARKKSCNNREKNDGVLELCYIGTMGYSYDIPCVLEALNIYNTYSDVPKISFLAMGSGPLLDAFKKYAVKLGIDCEFTGMLAYEDMVDRMCGCDIVINPIVKDAVASIINKVGDYALSGLPVINTQESMEYRQLIDDYHCGINCNVGDASAIANALVVLAKNPSLRIEMGKNSRRLGLERFDRQSTYQKIVELINI